MIRVANKKCIRSLSRKSLRASRTRNLIAVMAIALTTLLFTALFTIAMSINESYQQSNFRQAGGWAHATFKYISHDQLLELRSDPGIKEGGERLFVGMPQEPPFQKISLEISYGDETWAKLSYVLPTTGSLPQEGSSQAATDTRVLSLLGIEPELGASFTLTFDVDGRPTTETFTLCGWWEYDPGINVSNLVMPKSRAEEILERLDARGDDGITGLWCLDVLFHSSMNIEDTVEEILASHGYQNDTGEYDENYVNTGVNWGYTGSQIAQSLDPSTAAAMVAMLALIAFTGYLIIYNVFQISVVGDIRFYGLLKTIGTTPRQLRAILGNQALVLCLGGIPLGCLLGWLVGSMLTPAIISSLNDMPFVAASANPLIFLLAAVFSLITVLLSCLRPGRLAGKVSPVEAVRYTEQSPVKGRGKRRGTKVSLPSMALANLGRSRGKTLVTILSLALAVVLLNLTVVFTGGFDMDKYLRHKATDFVVAQTEYFRTGSRSPLSLPEEVIADISAQGGEKAGGRVYSANGISHYVTPEYARQKLAVYSSPQEVDRSIALLDRNQAGLVAQTSELYGMEDFPMSRLTLIEGDLESLQQPGNIALVVRTDDYGDIIIDPNQPSLGDKIPLRYVEGYEFYNPDTGEVYEDGEDLNDKPFALRPKEYRDGEYTLTAVVTVPFSISFRYFGPDRFLMSAENFIIETQSRDIMLYAMDMEDEQSLRAMEDFLQAYTGGADSLLSYESKATYQGEFDRFKSMFALLGGALSFIVGMVGILNFFNSILTGILTRKRELAMLQSIGMTGKQLKGMLIFEGLYYVLGAIGLSLLLAVFLGPVLASAMESMFWFFTYRFTVTAILALIPVFLLLGCCIPLVVYRAMARATIVERLREAE